ncbi:MAG TPA: TolC family protein [Bacteroidia bacterium]|nr:TolC family protein [Bacteroidia bacterium]
MKQFKAYTLIVALTMFLYTSNAQETNKTSFSLQEAIDYGLKNSPGYKSAELDVENANYRRKEITGLGLPQVTGSFDVKKYLSIPVQVIPTEAFGGPPGGYTTVQFGVPYNGTAGLNASQLIFSSDYIFGLKAAKEYMNLARMSVTNSKSQMVSQISKAYYNVMINKDRIKLLEANVTRLKKIYEETKAFNQQGFVELIDVERLEVAYNNLNTEKDKVLRLIGMSEMMLKFQMGYTLSNPIVVSDSLNMRSEEFQELAAGKMDISQRPDYILLQSQQSLLDMDLKSKKWGYLPTVAAYGAYQYTTQRIGPNIFESDKSNPIKQWYKVALVGVTLNLNIFDGFQRHNKIQQARIASTKNNYALKTLEMAAELEVNVATISYNNAYFTLQSNKRNMELAQHVVDVAQKKYTNGVGSNIEVVTAETSLKEAQTNYYNAVFDMLVAKVDYQKALGTLVK